MKGSGMPQIRTALGGWQRRITMVRRSQNVVDGLVVTTDVPFSFRGTIQPLGPQEIALKPEGQRSWEWIQIHAQSFSIMEPDDRIVYNNKIFKIMAQNDYSLSGFIEYHLVRDYQDGA